MMTPTSVVLRCAKQTAFGAAINVYNDSTHKNTQMLWTKMWKVILTGEKETVLCGLAGACCHLERNRSADTVNIFFVLFD